MDYRPPGPHHISVTDYTKHQIAVPFDVICCAEEFVRTKLRGAVEIDRGSGFVRAQGDHIFDAFGHGGRIHILDSENIRFDAFKRVVLGRWHLFEGCGMNDPVDSFHDNPEAVLIADVTDEKGQVWTRCSWVSLRHFKLL